MENFINILIGRTIVKQYTHLMFFVLFFCHNITLSQYREVNWMTFEQLEDSLNVKPKKVLLFFYADWCAYCKKMDRTAYKNPEVIKLLTDNFYAVKMNTESTDSIRFYGKVFVNDEIHKKRRPNHQLALFFASRKNRPFTLPATLILDEEFKVQSRLFRYLSPKEMISILPTEKKN